MRLPCDGLEVAIRGRERLPDSLGRPARFRADGRVQTALLSPQEARAGCRLSGPAPGRYATRSESDRCRGSRRGRRSRSPCLDHARGRRGPRRAGAPLLLARSNRDVEDAVIDRFHPMRYDLAPGRYMPANGVMARINNLGLRGPDAEIPKRRTRILCLGDSATFGYAPDVTRLRHLSRAARRDAGGSPSRQIRGPQRRAAELLDARLPGILLVSCLGAEARNRRADDGLERHAPRPPSASSARRNSWPACSSSSALFRGWHLCRSSGDS